MKGWEPRLIVAGVDGSDQSIRAAAVAASLARARGARLVIVTVVRPPEGWWGIVGSPPTAEALGDSLSDAQRDVLDTTIAGLDLEDVDYGTREEIGDASIQLTSVCEELDADLLVVGRRGAGLLRRMVVGSVANHLIHESSCPVIVVP
jgi:nucleotide-binding universal stress UspA family protein